MAIESVLEHDGDDPFGTDIDAEIAEVAGVLNAQHGRLVEITQRVLADDSWQQAGVHSSAQWLALKVGLSPHRAKQIVRVAERRGDFPCVHGALDRGELAIDQVVAVVEAPAWADSRVLDFAKAATVSQLRTTMRDQFFDDGTAGAEPEPPVPARERLSTSHDDVGRWRINGEADPARGAIVDAALAEAKNSLFERGDADATWFDALVEISERSLDAIESASRRDRFRTWIHLDADTADAATTDGWRIPPSVRDQILCDGVVQPVWEREGRPFSVGRSQRIVPARTRRVIERRDRGCRVPGCTNRRYVDIHHISHWLRGGSTDLWNLISLCRRHHRLHHQGRLGIAGNADQPGGVTFTDHRGNVIAPCGRPKIPDQPPPKPESGYEHPTGERLDLGYFTGWVHPDIEQARRNRHRN